MSMKTINRAWRLSLILATGVFLNRYALASGTVSGRFVQVMLPGEQRTLSLAEVEVFSGGKNIALGKPATQTSTAHGGDPRRATDGKTDGEWARNSITHTAENVRDPAWEVDLGKTELIEKIVLWNRNGFESRLDRARVMILDEQRKVVWGADLADAGRGAITLTVQDSPAFALNGKVVANIAPAAAPAARAPAGRDLSGLLSGTPASLRLAIEDLNATFGARYPQGKEFLERLDAIEPQFNSEDGKAAFLKLKSEALMANPLLDFNELLLVRRRGPSGLPQNWQGNSSLRKQGYDNEITILSPLLNGGFKTVHKPDGGAFVGDVCLHFDADKMLFSSIGKNGAWAVFEIRADGSGLREVSKDYGGDVDQYDAIYLPGGRIIYNSSSGYDGVPCVGGKDFVANLHIMNADGSGKRRLCFEQDNDWYPTMLPNGRVLYLRWEYTDSAHYFSRVLMHMNPDGTDQKGFYGSNSYWPNSLFYARPVPGSSSKFVGIVSGHHGVAREGELVLFDVTRGRFEADGAVQRIPGYGRKVEAVTRDHLVDGSNPRFLHPHPLSDKYFLVSCNALGGWSLFLVDVFDNFLLLKQESGTMLLEPIPLRKTPRPPVLPDRVNLAKDTATMLISDIYEGPGLAGVPRDTVKAIRIYQYDYSPRNFGGHYAIGMESGWDVRVILGTVPVEEDGSASFTVPANTPITLQPLDREGKALQMMRSWTVGMPGEVVSCVGCHESQNTAPPARLTQAMRIKPHELTAWHGPRRGFSFEREVQPVLDRFCVGCHDGSQPPAPGNRKVPNFSNPRIAYTDLHPYVRRNGPEGDYHILTPLEFHANTSELIQLLEKGHHNVRLDAEAWDRLITWIDLNVPRHGTWTEAGANRATLRRRFELAQKINPAAFDAEVIVNPYTRRNNFIRPAEPTAPSAPAPRIDGWPFDAAAAAKMQGDARTLELDAGGVNMTMVRIPAGAFPMGSNDETPMERPVSRVQIAKPFWMGATEVTLEQYRQFDPGYENGVYDMHYKDQVNRGYFMNDPKFPVIRVTWDQAMAYCAWLSEKTGRKVTLPTEAQWEWACRAGADTPLHFGGLDDDFSKYANLSDLTVKEMAVHGVDPKPIRNPGPDVDFKLKDARFNDGVLHLARVGRYQPNAWGLHDMHGNVAEWTRSDYLPYPYGDRDDPVAANGRKAVRGGSWHDRQHRATASYRLGFPHWQRVYNVGFRVVIEN
jgi:formylglycine-generating enzyme required for sulfatase activity